MQEFLNKPFLDNTVGSFLWPVIIVLLAILFKNYLSRFFATLGYKLIKRWAPGVEKKDFISLLLKPLGIFLVFLIFVAAIDHLNYPRILNFQIHFLHTNLSSLLRALKLIILTAFFFWIILRLIDFTALVVSYRTSLAAHPSDNQIVLFFRDFIKAVILIIGFIIIMKFLVGKDWTSKMVGALGIGAAALALAAKETIENLIGSFIILLDKPFRLGDYVKVNDVSGVVEKIGLRSTRIRSDNKTYITMPNKIVVDSVLDDITLMTQRRVVLLIELDATTPSDSVINILEDIRLVLKGDREVMDNFTLNLNDISRHSYTVQVIYYTLVTEWQAFNTLKQRINLGIIKSIESRQVKLTKNIDLSS